MSICVSGWHVHEVPLEARNRHQIPWSQNYSWALGTELRSSARAPSHLEVCLTTDQDSLAQQTVLVHSPNKFRTQEMRAETIEPLKPQNVSLLNGLRIKSNRNTKQSN